MFSWLAFSRGFAEASASGYFAAEPATGRLLYLSLAAGP